MKYTFRAILNLRCKWLVGALSRSSISSLIVNLRVLVFQFFCILVIPFFNKLMVEWFIGSFHFHKFIKVLETRLEVKLLEFDPSIV